MTNVDVLDFASLDDPVDEVWVVAPMAGDVFRRPATALLHRRIQQTLFRELSAVPNGVPVRLFTPGRDASEAMGIDLMSDDRSGPTILSSFLETGTDGFAERPMRAR